MQKVGVVGAGTMGQGIVQVCAQARLEVVLRDVDEAAVERGVSAIAGRLARLVEKAAMSGAERDAALGRIHAVTTLDHFDTVDLCIEAATENPDLKVAIFRELDAVCPPHAVLASNTSSISLTRIAAATRRPGQVVGLHFFNPVPIMKLVEIIRALQTTDATYEAARALVERLGKSPVQVGDSPGFAVNRMLVPMINEAVFALSEGVATAEEIDTAMKLGANHPIGPLALADLIGLDVCLYVMDVLRAQFADSKYRAAPLLRQMVDAGYLGRKSGRGFFEYGK
jgi:3-hydroxybutyryl-CoA dehydrogenase